MVELNNLGFIYLCDLKLDEEKKIYRKFTKRNEYVNVLYAFVIESNVVYIGKTNDLWKRFDTYRNAKYWKNAFISNAIKTDLLENAIKKKKVSLYIKHNCDLSIESDIITKLNPNWNKHYAKHSYAKY